MLPVRGVASSRLWGSCVLAVPSDVFAAPDVLGSEALLLIGTAYSRKDSTSAVRLSVSRYDRFLFREQVVFGSSR